MTGKAGLSPVRVRIRDFQSIGDLELDVSGFTCVTGPTNIGKSAIIRAISGALLGSPVVGDVRRGSRFCSVEMRSDGWSLKWEKGERGVNRYWIPSESEQALDKVGQGQIPQVAALGFGSVKIGQDVVQPWFATQFEPVFLMNKSGPAVTDFLSEVSRLKVLQDGITINVRNRRRLLDRARIREEDAEKLRGREAAFGKVQDMVQLKADLEAQMESIREYGERISELQDFLNAIDAEAGAIGLLRGVRELKVPPDPASGPMESLRHVVRSYGVLESEAAAILALRPAETVEVPEGEGLGAEVRRLSRATDLMGRLSSERAAVDALSGEVGVPDAPEVPSGLRRLAELADASESLRKEVGRLEEELGSAEAEFLEVQEEIDSIPVCPTCRRPLAKGAHVRP